MQFIDTHCHIHEPQYGFDIPKEIKAAQDVGVEALFFVGTSLASSKQAIECAHIYDSTYAVVGVHPHEAEEFYKNYTIDKIIELIADASVIGIGEIGLDYFYEHSKRELQQKLFREQLTIADTYKLPVVFHMRGSKENSDDAFVDFWDILNDFPNIKRGIVHSFTASSTVLKEIINHGFLIGINGIMTFSSDPDHHHIAKTIPLDAFVLETDAPYLTPKPFRGTINTPKNVELVAKYLATHRGENIQHIASVTTQNVKNLFHLT